MYKNNKHHARSMMKVDIEPALFVKSRSEVPIYYKNPDPVKRFAVSLHLASWNVVYPDYMPTHYTDAKVVKNDMTVNPAGWADPWSILKVKDESKGGKTVQEELALSEQLVKKYGFAGAVKEHKSIQPPWKLRFSYTGPFRYDMYGYPLCPIGRTGLAGRGTLGNWYLLF
jgi:hypothetical protein